MFDKERETKFDKLEKLVGIIHEAMKIINIRY